MWPQRSSKAVLSLKRHRAQLIHRIQRRVGEWYGRWLTVRRVQARPSIGFTLMQYKPVVTAIRLQTSALPSRAQALCSYLLLLPLRHRRPWHPEEQVRVQQRITPLHLLRADCLEPRAVLVQTFRMHEASFPHRLYCLRTPLVESSQRVY